MYAKEYDGAIDAFHTLMIQNLYYKKEPVQPQGYCKLYFKRKYSFSKLVIEDCSIEAVITYHPFYQVPAFYFRAIRSETSRMMSIEQLLELFPGFKPEKLTLDSPDVVPGVWMCVHPCETSQQMEAIKGNTDDYMRMWFAFYGLPAVFSEISLRPESEAKC